MCVVYCIDSGRSAYAPSENMRRLHVEGCMCGCDLMIILAQEVYFTYVVGYCTITHMCHGACAQYLG